VSGIDESRFTNATKTCPHPERWTSHDGDSSEVEVSDLAWGLVRAVQPQFAIETGTAYGQTTRRIGEALASNSPIGVLMAFENDAERAATTRDNCFGLPVMVMEKDSTSYLPPEEIVIDFSWFDTWSELRIPEFWHFRPRMRQGSIVCFHDTAPGHGANRMPSGRDTRTEIEVELRSAIRFVHLPTPRGVTIGEVL